ncbi:response regulator transcription factor [Frondihabitans cladoniiphilus]|uniref:Response regulator transcription factor n=1 Tax=Frondihabitans cladoniiphilus TaxID=715785 RepID=A0ABP8VQK8_9MICO
MAEPRIRVLIVDDQPLFASGLELQIAAQADLECVGVAYDGREAIALVDSVRPDVVLMDLRMPGMNGVDATAAITGAGVRAQAANGPSGSGKAGDCASVPKVVVLTTIRRDEAVFHALRAGASAFLTKDATPAVLLGTIRGVHSGLDLTDPESSLDVIQEFARPAAVADAPDPLAPLSVREREVFGLLTRGLSNAEVASTLFLSEATVKSHVQAILQKLQLRGRVQLVIFAYESGLAAV